MTESESPPDPDGDAGLLPDELVEWLLDLGVAVERRDYRGDDLARCYCRACRARVLALTTTRPEVLLEGAGDGSEPGLTQLHACWIDEALKWPPIERGT